MEIIFLKMNGQFYGVNYIFLIYAKKSVLLSMAEDLIIWTSEPSTQLSLICCKGTWLIIERKTRREGNFNKGNPVPRIGKFHTLDETQVCEHH